MNARAAPPGIGMTSQRTRDRMIARLREQGITDDAVLGAMAFTGVSKRKFAPSR